MQMGWEMHLWAFVIHITEANYANFAVFCQNFAQHFLTNQKLLKFLEIPNRELRLPQFPGIPDGLAPVVT